MKPNINIQKIVSILILIIFANKIYSQEWQSNNFGNYGHSIDFLNANTGYVSVTVYENGGEKYKILKTTNKGVAFSPIWTSSYNNWNVKGVGFDMISEQVGFVYTEGILYRTTNGGTSWVQRFQIANEESFFPTIKFANENLGFISYTPYPFVAADSAKQKIYRITNGGNSWTITFNSTTAFNLTPIIKDISISDSNIIMVGYYYNYQQQGQIRRYTLVSSNYGTGFGVEYDGGTYGTQFSNAQYLSGGSEYKIIGSENYGPLNPNNGTYCYDNFEVGNKYKITNGTENIGGLSFVDVNKGYAYVDNKIYKTINSGVNWSEVYTFEQNSTDKNRNALVGFNDIVYAVEHLGNLVTHKLSTNFLTIVDNQSTTSSFFFDGTEYTSPNTQYLRGGYSLLSCLNILNTGQSNERIFYKWSDGKMQSDNQNYYFDMSGTTIANYYKTKQLSTTSTAISNSGQSKIIKDGLGALNQIHQSMDGGIFYTKSYNNGSSYKSEEVVNNTAGHSIADGNKNPSLVETRLYSATSGGYPVNKNITVCWERFNSASGNTEIKAAVRNYNIFSDTSFFWQSWEDVNYSDVFTEFTSSAGYNSNPKIFAIAMDPVNNLGNPSTYFLIIPHLRPSSNGNKIQVTCRKGNLYQEFALDSGDISDLSVTDSTNYFGSLPIYFTYRKDNQIIYRKIKFVFDWDLYISKFPVEGPTVISSGDGYASRSKPDISLMNGVPVVSYAANYNANMLVEYEGGGTDVITVNRYPIIKVQRIDATHWGSYVIYNSNRVQDNPDIEGSTDTKSYLLNYSSGSGQFKKVVSVFGQPGYFCEPNTFTGTDSKLIKNSYNGLYGSNLSMLTLSPNAGLYKLDMQYFNITNINTADNADNLGGVVNLDTVRYSFNLGPILIKENNGDNYITGAFGESSGNNDPIITPVEFNQNLRSNPFLLNETQALLLGCNVTYIKDDIDAVVNPVRYSVNLVNKTSGLLHRVLYQDTIHTDDSVATEFLRGYYITDIPNDEDSFYVQISVNNDDIAGGNYYINPGHNDNEAMGDNSSGHKTKIVFEKENIHNLTNSIPAEYSLNQNYPNPFNPVTNLGFGISKLGFVTLKVYNSQGKEVATLVNEIKPAGRYDITFNGSNFSSGVYFYKLESNGFIETKKMLLIK